MTATMVDPEKILRDLRKLWNDLGKGADVTGGVLRACGMTLIVVTDSEADSDDLRRTLGVLMHNHPARAIVVRLNSKPGIDATVFSQCWMPFGKHQQICAEGIEITAGASDLHAVGQLLLPLIVSDLPAVLWCRTQRIFSGGAFADLLPLVQKVIVDSTTAPDPYAAVAAVRELRRQGRLISDLSWTKLTGLRELMASLFDEGATKGLKSVKIYYAGDAPTVSVIYLEKWLERALPEVSVTLEQKGDGARSLRSIELKGDREVTLTRPDKTTMEVRCSGNNDRVRRTTMILFSEEILMSEELSILGPDPVFDKVLA